MNDQPDRNRTERMLQWFSYAHLPQNLQPVSAAFGVLAWEMCELIPAGPERTAGLRKLLEAKDCMVRARLEVVQGATGGGDER